MRYTKILFYIPFVLMAVLSCNDPAQIGSDLLEEDQLSVEFSDNIPVSVSVETGSAVQSYSPFISQKFRSHLLGKYQDNLTGLTNASIYTQLIPGNQERPRFNLSGIDSIVMVIPYDTLTNGGYGDLSQPVTLEVLQLEEDMPITENLFSDQTFATGELLGTATFTPAPTQERRVRDYTAEEAVDTIFPPHIRIPLSGEFEQRLITDTLLFTNDSTFLDFFKGIYIHQTNPTAGLMNLNFGSGFSRVSLYYTTNGQPREYLFLFNIASGLITRLGNFEHNYSGSLAQDLLDGTTDSLCILQGMAGVNTVVSFPDLSDFEGIVINKAELELTVADFSTADTNYYAAPQLVASTDESGELEIITDVRNALLGDFPINNQTFGGNLVEEEEDGKILQKYYLNISDYIQRIIDGEAPNRIIITSGVVQPNYYLQIQPNGTDPSRTVICGPGHSTYPLKLNLVFTRL